MSPGQKCAAARCPARSRGCVSKGRANITPRRCCYSSAAADGKQAVMLDGVCAGIAASLDGELSQGEVRLYSAGGAEILLKNTGEVVINGQSFPPKS